jgi:hypothetical protein
MIFLLLARSAFAEEPAPDARAPAPNPAKGERYDGREPGPKARAVLLGPPRFLLFPFRLLFWGLEPPVKAGVQFEQRHHLYGRLYSLSTSDDGQIGIRPTFTWLRSFRPSFGAYLFDDRLMGPGTKFDLELSGGVDVVRAALHGRPTHIGRPVQAFFDTIYNRRNDFLFTGIGSAIPPLPGQLPASRYQADVLDVAGRLQLQATRFLAFSFGGYFGLRRFANGESYSGDAPIADVYCVRDASGACVPGTVSEALVPGFNNGTQFLRASAGLHLDLRNDVIRPSTGLLVDAQIDYSHGLGHDDPSSYVRVWGSAAFDIDLYRHSHILVLRATTELVVPAGNEFVPFSELATVGGPYTLPGFRYQEFRDFSSFVASAEYRFPLLLWVDASVFGDYGGVFGRNYRGFGDDRLQPDVGFGFLLHSRDRFYVKLQFAYGFDNSWQIYITGLNLP